MNKSSSIPKLCAMFAILISEFVLSEQQVASTTTIYEGEESTTTNIFDGVQNSTFLSSSPAAFNQVVGGTYASFGEYPYYVGIGVYEGSDWVLVCGGALIHPNWVLTAGHCVVDGYKYGLDIGRYSFSRQNGGQKVDMRDADSICAHKNFNYVNVENDLGLIHIKDPSSIAPVQLDVGGDAQFYTQYTPLQIVGMGSTGKSGNGPYPDDLREGDVFYVPQDKCEAEWGMSIGDQIMCARAKGSGDACKGDSGGPLLRRVGSDHVLTGIVSFGPVPCDAEVPVLYSKVSSALSWIRNVIKYGTHKDFCH